MCSVSNMTFHKPCSTLAISKGLRSLTPPRHGRRVRGGAARFDFDELCDRPLGAADYLALSQAFHTVFIDGVPRMSLAVRPGI